MSENKEAALIQKQQYEASITELIGPEYQALVLKNKTIVYPEEASDKETPWYMRKKWEENPKTHHRYTFLDAVQDYTENHFAIWKCQHHYTESAMRFLMMYHDSFNLESLDDCSDMEMGLLCASGGYCQLTIGDAPQVLAWYIGEYDGKESIVVQP